MPTKKVCNIIKVETFQEMPNSGCTLWPVYARKKSLTVYSPRPAFGGAADTLAVIESNMYNKWHSTWAESSQRRPWIAIFMFPSSASDRCTDRNIIGVPYGLDGNICQDKSMGDIGTLTMFTEDRGHSRMIMPVMPQHMILIDSSYKELDQIEDDLKTEGGVM